MNRNLCWPVNLEPEDADCPSKYKYKCKVVFRSRVIWRHFEEAALEKTEERQRGKRDIKDVKRHRLSFGTIVAALFRGQRRCQTEEGRREVKTLIDSFKRPPLTFSLRPDVGSLPSRFLPHQWHLWETFSRSGNQAWLLDRIRARVSGAGAHFSRNTLD